MRGSATPNGTPSQTAQVGAYSAHFSLSRVPKSEVASAKRRKHDSDALRSGPSGEPPPPTHELVVRIVQLFASNGSVEKTARARLNIFVECLASSNSTGNTASQHVRSMGGG